MPYRLATSQCLEVALALDTQGIVSRNHHFGKLFFQKPFDKKLLNFLPSSAIIHNTAYAGLVYRYYAAFPRLRGGFDSRIPLHTKATLRGGFLRGAECGSRTDSMQPSGGRLLARAGPSDSIVCSTPVSRFAFNHPSGWLFAWSGMWESNRFHATVRWTVAREGWTERHHNVLDSCILFTYSLFTIHFSLKRIGDFGKVTGNREK